MKLYKKAQETLWNPFIYQINVEDLDLPHHVTPRHPQKVRPGQNQEPQRKEKSPLEERIVRCKEHDIIMQRAADDETINNQQDKCKNLQIDI